MRGLGVLACAILVACTDETDTLDSGLDSGPDSGLDAGRGDSALGDLDGSIDGSVDAGSGDARADAEVEDLGPPDSGARDTGTPPGVPLLEPAVDPRVACGVTAAVENQSPRSWYQGGHTFVSWGGQAVLVRTESNPSSPFDPAPTDVVFGPVESDGTLGVVETIRALPEGTSSIAPAAVVVDDQLMVLWSEGFELMVAIEGPSGSIGPRSLGWPVTDFTRVAIAVGHGGAGLVYSAYDYNAHQYVTTFGRASSGGMPIGSPIQLLRSREDPSPTLVATQSGWAVLMRRDGDLAFLTFAPDGTAVSARVVVADGELVAGRGAGFDRARHALLPTEDGFLAAWVESKPSFDQGSFAGVRLARLSASGELASDPIWVRAPEVDVDEVEPALSWLGTDVALTWARGQHIYICAGCMPDHRVDVVVFDPDSMTPVSEVISVDPPAAGGLLRRAESWVGDSLRMAFSITYHVHGEPGTAVVRCNDG